MHPYHAILPYGVITINMSRNGITTYTWYRYSQYGRNHSVDMSKAEILEQVPGLGQGTLIAVLACMLGKVGNHCSLSKDLTLFLSSDSSKARDW